MATAAVAHPVVDQSQVQHLPTSLRANKGTVKQHQLGWLRPTSADASLEEIRRRLQDDGYVWMKGILPREDVLRMREDFFSHYHGTGLLKPGTAAVDGIYNNEDDVSLHVGIGGGDPAHGSEELKRLLDAHHSDHYLGFTNHPILRKTIRNIMSWDEEVMLMRTLLRHAVPGGNSTGLHYDKQFLRGGDAYFLTAWVPIGDIGTNGGGLYYLDNSAHLGDAVEDHFQELAKDFTPEQKMNAFNSNMMSTGYLSDHPEEFMSIFDDIAKQKGMQEYKWLVANFEAGDVVFHHPGTIHGSCGNDDALGRIRLSADLRFYDKKDFDAGAADNRWMKFWTLKDGL